MFHMSGEYLFHIKDAEKLAPALCAKAVDVMQGRNPKNINVTPSTGDQITRLILRVMNTANLEMSPYFASQIVSADPEEGTNAISIQQANSIMAECFLGVAPRYANQTPNTPCYVPPRPSYGEYHNIMDQQAAMRRIFFECAGQEANAELQTWSEHLTNMSAVLAFPNVPKKLPVSVPPDVSFLLVGNSKPNYTLSGVNGGALQAALRAWAGLGQIRSFYTLNWTGAALGGGAIALNHDLPAAANYPAGPMKSLARAIEVIRYVAMVERFLGRILIVVNVQSGFWYHTQYAGTPTVTLTSNPIPAAPVMANTALDAELQRCHAHLSVRCTAADFLGGGQNIEQNVINMALNGLVACHPCFEP